jgi:hypothetical protein
MLRWGFKSIAWRLTFILKAFDGALEGGTESMNGDNQPLVVDEPVEFEKQPVEVQDFKKVTNHFRCFNVEYTSN